MKTRLLEDRGRRFKARVEARGSGEAFAANMQKAIAGWNGTLKNPAYLRSVDDTWSQMVAQLSAKQQALMLAHGRIVIGG